MIFYVFFSTLLLYKKVAEISPKHSHEQPGAYWIILWEITKKDFLHIKGLKLE